ncbi:MAG: hypothetical protein SOV83_03480 [Prevotella sp.]|nr:hypothetical protein [Prevotella sp.]
MELNLDIPRGVLPLMTTNKKPEIASYSDMRIQGFDKIMHNTVDLYGYNVKEKDLYKFIGQGSKQIFNLLKGWVGNSNELERHYGSNGEVPAVRILTPDKVYVIIADDTYNPHNKSKFRKVFNSGAKFTLSYSSGASVWKTLMSSVKDTYQMPVKKLIGGEVLLAGKLSGKWGVCIYRRSNFNARRAFMIKSKDLSYSFKNRISIRYKNRTSLFYIHSYR